MKKLIVELLPQQSAAAMVMKAPFQAVKNCWETSLPVLQRHERRLPPHPNITFSPVEMVNPLGTPKYRCLCWRNAQGQVFVGVAHHCPKFHHPQVPFPKFTLTLSHTFSPPFCDSINLETPTGEMENASAPGQPLNPRTGHSS